MGLAYAVPQRRALSKVAGLIRTRTSRSRVENGSRKEDIGTKEADDD
jgi:hypothetical protein